MRYRSVPPVSSGFSSHTCSLGRSCRFFEELETDMGLVYYSTIYFSLEDSVISIEPIKFGTEHDSPFNRTTTVSEVLVRYVTGG